MREIQTTDSLVFVGDIAIGDIRVEVNIPEFFFDKKLVGNLEGGIISNSLKSSNSVYNSAKHKSIYKSFYLFCLANNHIFDVGSAKDTVSFLKEIQVPFTGLRKKDSEGHFSDKDFIFLNFGWPVIKAKGKKDGFMLNTLTIKNVTNAVKTALAIKSKKVICIFHWGYELELYPHPMFRELSHSLIDLGVALIIGHHSHLVQPIEIYKNVPIVYGLGNFIFTQKFFFNGKHTFPKQCNRQLAFEFENNGKHKLHWIKYSKKDQAIYYIRSEFLKESKMVKNDLKFTNLSNDEYKIWFKNNRIKNYYLPIYYYSDSSFSIFVKNTFINIRQMLISVFLALGIKKWE